MALITAFAGSVAPFEDDADLEALANDPLLELHELDMQARKFALVLLSAQLAIGSTCRLSLSCIGSLPSLMLDACRTATVKRWRY